MATIQGVIAFKQFTYNVKAQGQSDRTNENNQSSSSNVRYQYLNIGCLDDSSRMQFCNFD